jgi:O-antigen/teichoic acid export membrane protein
MLFKRLAGDALWVTLARLIIGGSSLVIVTVLSRLISPDDLGRYMLLLSLVLGVSIFSMFGMDQTAVRELAKFKAKHDGNFPTTLVKNFFFVTTLTLLLSCLLLFLGKELLDQFFFKSAVLSELFLPVCLWVSFFVFAKLVTECFRGMHKVLLASLGGETLALVIFVSVILLLLWFNASLELSVLVWLMAGVYALSSIIGTMLLSRYCRNELDRHNEFSLKDAFLVGKPLTAIAVVSFFLSQADLWVLAFFFEAKEVAVYGVVLRVIALISIPLMIVNLVIKPYIPNLYAKGEKKKLERLMRVICTLLLIPSSMLLLGLSIYSADILSFLFGENYAQGGSALSILVLAALVQIGTGSCGTLLIMTGHQKDLLYISLISGLLLLILLFFLVEPFAMIGCAIATTVAAIFQNFTMLLMAKKRTGLWTLPTLNINLSFLRVLGGKGG